VANRSAVVLTLNHDSCFVRNGSVTQAWALKVSDLTGAIRNLARSSKILRDLLGLAWAIRRSGRGRAAGSRSFQHVSLGCDRLGIDRHPPPSSLWFDHSGDKVSDPAVMSGRSRSRSEIEQDGAPKCTHDGLVGFQSCRNVVNDDVGFADAPPDFLAISA
jgi:hypothetical protein